MRISKTVLFSMIPERSDTSDHGKHSPILRLSTFDFDIDGSSVTRNCHAGALGNRDIHLQRASAREQSPTSSDRALSLSRNDWLGIHGRAWEVRNNRREKFR